MVNIKEQNYWMIHDDFILNHNRIIESKLKALFKLISKKGIYLQTKSFSDIKFLEIKPGFFIGIKHTSFKENCFYPCKIQKYSIQKYSIQKYSIQKL